MFANNTVNPLVPEIDQKIRGCWRGKVIGGTLGAPYEGCPHKLKLEYYQPLPRVSLANDDLDIQVLWAQILTQKGFPVSSHVLAQTWVDHIDFPWDEYGVAMRNIKMGIMPPASGMHDNFFTDGLGAAIRSELWACLAAGNPSLAAKLAYEDACIDHAGNGIYMAQFLAAMQSQAFIDSDIDSLIDTGLKFIPHDCRIAAAIRKTRQLCSNSNDWDQIHAQVMKEFGSSNFTDVCMNVCFVILGLLLGEKDFDKSLCYAVNCGQDTDCTAATVGATLGILCSGNIPYRWQVPIGDKLVISKEIRYSNLPKTVTEFTQQVIELHRNATKYYSSSEAIDSAAQSVSCKQPQTCTLKFSDCPGAIIEVDYPANVRVQPNRIENIHVRFRSTSRRLVLDGNITKPQHWMLHGNEKFRLECEKGSTQMLRIPVSYASENIRQSLDKITLNSKVNGLPYNLELPLVPTMPWQVTSEPIPQDMSSPGIYAGDSGETDIYESTGFWMPAHLKLEPNKTCRMRQSFLLDSARDITAVVVCNFDCLVWIDDSLVIKRSADELFIPSFHRSSNKSLAVYKIEAGWHSWEIAIHSVKLTEIADILLHVGLGDLASQQWLRPKAWAAHSPAMSAVGTSHKSKDSTMTYAGTEAATD